MSQPLKLNPADCLAIASDYRAAAQDAARHGRFSEAQTLIGLAAMWDPPSEDLLYIPIDIESFEANMR